jgi:hypothetical protein
MRNSQVLSLSFRKFIFTLLLISTFGGETGYAEVLECEVGDLSRGYWYYNSLNSLSDTCPDPGPPAADSPMPMFPLNKEVYRISGRYKFRSYTSAEISHSSPPTSRPECITGYVDAYVAYMAGIRTDNCIATGSLLTCEGPSYCRFFENAFLFYEWKCNPQPLESPVKNDNLGPFCPI